LWFFPFSSFLSFYSILPPFFLLFIFLSSGENKQITKRWAEEEKEIKDKK